MQQSKTSYVNDVLCYSLVDKPSCAQLGGALRDACSPAEGRCERDECLGMLSAPALVCNNTVVPYRRCRAACAPCQGMRFWRSRCPSAVPLNVVNILCLLAVLCMKMS